MTAENIVRSQPNGPKIGDEGPFKGIGKAPDISSREAVGKDFDNLVVEMKRMLDRDLVKTA